MPGALLKIVYIYFFSEIVLYPYYPELMEKWDIVNQIVCHRSCNC